MPSAPNNHFDESFFRMKASCDRIAKVLGLDQKQFFEGSGNPAEEPVTVPVQRSVSRDRSREPREPRERSVPSANRRDEYHSVRQKSPHARQENEADPSVTKYTANVVKQSLGDLKERLMNIRREKQQMDATLCDYSTNNNI